MFGKKAAALLVGLLATSASAAALPAAEVAALPAAEVADAAPDAIPDPVDDSLPMSAAPDQEITFLAEEEHPTRRRRLCSETCDASRCSSVGNDCTVYNDGWLIKERETCRDGYTPKRLSAAGPIKTYTCCKQECGAMIGIAAGAPNPTPTTFLLKSARPWVLRCYLLSLMLVVCVLLSCRRWCRRSRSHHNHHRRLQPKEGGAARRPRQGALAPWTPLWACGSFY